MLTCIILLFSFFKDTRRIFRKIGDLGVSYRSLGRDILSPTHLPKHKLMTLGNGAKSNRTPSAHRGQDAAHLSVAS